MNISDKNKKLDNFLYDLSLILIKNDINFDDNFNLYLEGETTPTINISVLTDRLKGSYIKAKNNIAEAKLLDKADENNDNELKNRLTSLEAISWFNFFNK